MTNSEYLRKHLDHFMGNTPEELSYVAQVWEYEENGVPEAVIDILMAKEPIEDIEGFRLMWISPWNLFDDTESESHMRMQDNHRKHRERKIADNKNHMRKLALKKGEIVNGRTVS